MKKEIIINETPKKIKISAQNIIESGAAPTRIIKRDGKNIVVKQTTREVIHTEKIINKTLKSIKIISAAVRGAPGQDGDDGLPGDDGKSAYEVAVENGFVGSEAAWLASLQGADGEPGQDGVGSDIFNYTYAGGF